MPNMVRFATVGLLACVVVNGAAQMHVPEPTDDLATLLQALPLQSDTGGPGESYLETILIERLQTAPLPEVEANLPTLLAMTEAHDDQTRDDALLAVMNLGFSNAGNQMIAATGSTLPQLYKDDSAVELLVPYVPKLLCLLSRGTPTERSLSFSIVQEISRLHPAPPTLIQGLLRLLAARQSTLPLATIEDELRPGTPPDGPSLGPQLLWILLPAAATYYHNPATGQVEAWDPPEIQDAVLAFLERADQSPESLAASVRALAMALPQNPRVNATLIRLLDNGNPDVQLALVQQLPKLALTSDAFLVGKERVATLINDPSTTPDVRAAAARMLPCWNNDRSHWECPVAGSAAGN